jgi:hypothetical protein
MVLAETGAHAQAAARTIAGKTHIFFLNIPDTFPPEKTLHRLELFRYNGQTNL